MKFANSKSERGRNFRTRYTTISYFIRLIRLIYNYDFIAKIDLKRVDNKVELTIIFNDVLCTIILYNHFHNNYNIISWLICVYYNYKIQYANFSTDILIGIKATWWHVTHAHSFSLFCSFCFSVVSVTEQQIDTTRQVRDRSQVLPSTVLPQGDFSHRTLFIFSGSCVVYRKSVWLVSFGNYKRTTPGRHFRNGPPYALYTQLCIHDRTSLGTVQKLIKLNVKKKKRRKNTRTTPIRILRTHLYTHTYSYMCVCIYAFYLLSDMEKSVHTRAHNYNCTHTRI